MKPKTFAHLVEVIDEVIGDEDDDRDQMVYPDLAQDMALAARAVYDACLRGQQFAENESTTP